MGKPTQAREIARKKLSYVYIGNAQLPGASDTFCPNCGAEVISRVGYSAGGGGGGLAGRNCSACGTEIKFVGKIFE